MTTPTSVSSLWWFYAAGDEGGMEKGPPRDLSCMTRTEQQFSRIRAIFTITRRILLSARNDVPHAP